MNNKVYFILIIISPYIKLIILYKKFHLIPDRMNALVASFRVVVPAEKRNEPATLFLFPFDDLRPPSVNQVSVVKQRLLASAEI